jgi:hypothetical protein
LTPAPPSAPSSGSATPSGPSLWYQGTRALELPTTTLLCEARGYVSEWAKECGFNIAQSAGCEKAGKATLLCTCKGRLQRATDTKNKHDVVPEEARKRKSSRARAGEETCPFR